MTASRRFVSTWIAIAAILLNALMPTVSLALGSVRTQGQPDNGDWIEICSVTGSTWVRLGQDGQLLAQTRIKPAHAPAATHDDHCLYCLTHGASFGLPPALALVLPIWSMERDLSAGHEPAAHAVLEWITPATRAPPVAG